MIVCNERDLRECFKYVNSFKNAFALGEVIIKLTYFCSSRENKVYVNSRYGLLHSSNFCLGFAYKVSETFEEGRKSWGGTIPPT